MTGGSGEAGGQTGIGAALAFGILPSVAELRRRAREWFECFGVSDRIDPFEVIWSGRLSTSAGRAELVRRRILLNPRLLLRVPDQVDRILVHEVAHLAAHVLHGPGIKPHGPEWRALMARAGQNPEACHRFPIAGLQRRRFYYLHMCSSCGGRAVRRRSQTMRCSRCPRAEIHRFRAPRTRAGLRHLEQMSLEELRRHGTQATS